MKLEVDRVLSCIRQVINVQARIGTHDLVQEGDVRELEQKRE